MFNLEIRDIYLRNNFLRLKSFLTIVRIICQISDEFKRQNE